MNYDTMSVHDLLCEAFDPDAYLDEIESALRSAVIREASVGKLVFGTKEVVAVENPDFSHIETTIRFDWREDKRHPDALTEDLLLIPIPKETP